jgi:hypothetical protein
MLTILLEDVLAGTNSLADRRYEAGSNSSIFWGINQLASTNAELEGTKWQRTVHEQ